MELLSILKICPKVCKLSQRQCGGNGIAVALVIVYMDNFPIERIEGAHNVHVLYLAEDQYMNEEDIFFVDESDTADAEKKSQ